MAESSERRLGPIGREVMREAIVDHARAELRYTYKWFSPTNFTPPSSGRKWDDEAIRHDGATSMEKAKAFRRTFSDQVNHGREAALERLRRRFDI